MANRNPIETSITLHELNISTEALRGAIDGARESTGRDPRLAGLVATASLVADTLERLANQIDEASLRSAA